MIAKTAPRYECPKCGGHNLHLPVWDDDPYAKPEPSPVEDGFCLTKECGYKGYRMDFDPSGMMARAWAAAVQ